jgi:hypothetical protein
MSKPLETTPVEALKAGPLSRRTVFAGAGAVGALATVAAVLPATRAAAPVAQAGLAAADAGGYQLTEHVQRYYQTARV